MGLEKEQSKSRSQVVRIIMVSLGLCTSGVPIALIAIAAPARYVTGCKRSLHRLLNSGWLLAGEFNDGQCGPMMAAEVITIIAGAASPFGGRGLTISSRPGLNLDVRLIW